MDDDASQLGRPDLPRRRYYDGIEKTLWDGLEAAVDQNPVFVALLDRIQDVAMDRLDQTLPRWAAVDLLFYLVRDFVPDSWFTEAAIQSVGSPRNRPSWDVLRANK